LTRPMFAQLPSLVFSSSALFPSVLSVPSVVSRFPLFSDFSSSAFSASSANSALILLFFRFLDVELSTGHPVKDAHPEGARRGGRAEGSLRPFSFFLLFLNSKPTTENLPLSFSPNSNYSRTYENMGEGGASRNMRSPITPLFSSATLTIC